MEEPINKDFYKNQILKATDMIKNKADDILKDWNNSLQSISIVIDIKPCEIATIDIKKKYIPEVYKLETKEELNNERN